MLTPRFGPLFILFFCYLLCWRGSFALIDPEEARYAEIPRQMLHQNRWLVPVFDGQSYLDKPPLLFWSVQLSLQAFGIHVWAARMIPFLACLLTALVTYWWASRIHSNYAGLAGALGLLMMPNYLLYAPMLTINGLLGLFITISLATGYVALQQTSISWKWWTISAISTGLALLTKGPIALAIIFVPLFLSSWLAFQLMRPSLRQVIWYIIVCLLVSLPWFALVAWHEPHFVDHFIWRHNIERVFTPFDHAEPFWYYLPEFCLGSFPWIFAVTVWLLCPNTKSKSTLVIRYFLMSACWILLLFSLAGSKRQMYLVPLYPVLSIAVGLILADGLHRFPVRWLMACTFVGIGSIVWASIGVPRYYERYTIDTVVVSLRDTFQIRSIPILCYPHSWPSIGFTLDRDDIRSFSLEHLKELIEEVAKVEPCLLFIKPSLANRVLEEMPSRFIVKRIAGNSRTVVVSVRRK